MKVLKVLLVVFSVSCMFVQSGFGQDASPSNTEAFKNALERDGFFVQKGEMGSFDLIKLLNAGVAPSAYGNNPSTPYMIFFVPAAPGSKVKERASLVSKTLGMRGDVSPYFSLRPDEAIIFVGKTPPECRFFSFDFYLFHRTFGSETKWIWANFGDSLNNMVIRSEGTPEGRPGNPFNQTTMIISTADKGIDRRIRNAAQSSGYSDSIINTQVIPSRLLNMGLEDNSDTFMTAIRPALFTDQQAGSNYVNNGGGAVFRVTPKELAQTDPYDVPEVRVRGTGKTELKLTADLQELRKAILSKYNGSSGTELPISKWVPEGNDGIQRGINPLAPTNDACYLWTASQTISSPTPPFCDLSKFYGFLRDPGVTLGNDPNEFMIVYGINHVAFGKATYSNFALYGADVWNGVGAITDSQFKGTAEEYLPNNPNAKYLYVYKIARNCNGESHCYEVPYGVKAEGIELDQPLFVGFRIYLEGATKTGPSYSEIIYDRVIKFAPKEK